MLSFDDVVKSPIYWNFGYVVDQIDLSFRVKKKFLNHLQLNNSTIQVRFYR